MIEIINRELLIPPEEYNIGTNYDSNTEERHFHMKRIVSSGVDLASLDFHLDMQYTNGDKNSVTLTKDVTEKDINLTLPIVNSMLQVPGAVLIQLRALTEDGTCKWTSYQGALFVEESINTPAAWEGRLTELEQLERDIQRVEDDISGLNTDEAARKEAEEARVEAENAREAAEETRAATFTENEAARQAAFDTAQATFESAETIRQNTYEADVAEFNEKQTLLRGYATAAESYAHGGTDSRAGEDTNNSKYWSEQSEINGERWSVGQIGGSDVPSSDATHHNNSKWWSSISESWAVGGTGVRSGENTNNSKYYADQSRIEGNGLASIFSDARDYSAGDYVIYGGILYEFITDHNAGAWNISDVHAVNMGDEVADLKIQLAGNPYQMPYIKGDGSGLGWFHLFVTPEMFGAVGDGNTDDTNAVQLALNAGNVLLTPQKTYLISRPLEMNVDGRTLGGWFGIEKTSVTPAYIVAASTFVGEYMLKIQSTQCTVCGVTFGTRKSGVYSILGQMPVSGQSPFASDLDIKIYGCHFIGSAVVHMHGRGIWIENCLFENPAYHAINIYGTHDSESSIYQRMDLYGGRAVRIINNRMHAPTGSRFLVYIYADEYDSQWYGLNVTNNLCDLSGGLIKSESKLINALISNNIVCSNYWQNIITIIKLAELDGVTICENILGNGEAEAALESNPEHAIEIGGVAKDVLIVNNQMIATDRVPIYFAETTQFITICNNIFKRICLEQINTAICAFVKNASNITMLNNAVADSTVANPVRFGADINTLFIGNNKSLTSDAPYVVGTKANVLSIEDLQSKVQTQTDTVKGTTTSSGNISLGKTVGSHEIIAVYSSDIMQICTVWVQGGNYFAHVSNVDMSTPVANTNVSLTVKYKNI